MREVDPTANHANMYANNYSNEQNQKFTADFGEVTQKFNAAMQAGTPATDPLVQDLVRQHYDFCLQFWTPSRDAYKSLAMSYIMPSPYRDSYEAVAPGLAKYHYDAIVTWADTNLK
ncbi:MAG: hypothetical protein RL351_54 [Actinomycetota bacterium]|jgi:hypothetical protein